MVNYLTAPHTGVHIKETRCGFEVWNGDRCSPAAYTTYEAAAYHADYLVKMGNMAALEPAEILRRHDEFIKGKE